MRYKSAQTLHNTAQLRKIQNSQSAGLATIFCFSVFFLNAPYYWAVVCGTNWHKRSTVYSTIEKNIKFKKCGANFTHIMLRRILFMRQNDGPESSAECFSSAKDLQMQLSLIFRYFRYVTIFVLLPLLYNSTFFYICCINYAKALKLEL